MPRRPSFLLAALAVAALALAPVLADARPGAGGSAGSRGSRTYSPPPSTSTAPGQARPMERTMTEPTRPSQPGYQPAPGAPAPGMSRGGAFTSGLLGGLIGAGIGGMLFGHGMFGGMDGGLSFLGLLLQIALIGGIIYLVVGWLRRRSQPALAGVPNGMARQMDQPPRGAMGGGGGPAAAPVNIVPADFNAFESILKEVNVAWSRQNTAGLQRICTPEMVQYFASDLADLASRGLHNETSDVRLEQGDLAEAWREGNREFATVAMRFSLLDATRRMADGVVVEGSLTARTQATELWTFVRVTNARWLLSAVQQTS